MAKIAIVPPVKTKTRGGMDATIFEIDTDDLQDGLNGEIYTPRLGVLSKSWSENGICSNSTDECNLDPHAPEVSAVVAKLRATKPS